MWLERLQRWSKRPSLGRYHDSFEFHGCRLSSYLEVLDAKERYPNSLASGTCWACSASKVACIRWLFSSLTFSEACCGLPHESPAAPSSLQCSLLAPARRSASCPRHRGRRAAWPQKATALQSRSLLLIATVGPWRQPRRQFSAQLYG